MQFAACTRCGELIGILYDGTLVEHAQPEQHALLCPGSRTKPEQTEREAREAPVVVRKRRELVFN